MTAYMLVLLGGMAHAVLPALPPVLLLIGDDLEQADQERYDYTVPRNLGAAPFYLSKFGE